jgi:hypothetical protein
MTHSEAFCGPHCSTQKLMKARNEFLKVSYTKIVKENIKWLHGSTLSRLTLYRLYFLGKKSALSSHDGDKVIRSDPEMYQCKSQDVCNNSKYLLRWIIALNAKPSRHELVKSVTRTPGYLAVVRLAHLNNASRADTLGSWPTTISDICRKKKGSLFLGEI